MEIFRPLFDETGEVKVASALKPIRSLLEDGTHSSVLLDIRPVALCPIDQGTRKKVIAYLKAVEQLSKLADTTISTSVLLHESGYGKFLAEQFPDEMLLESDEGIGSGNWTSAPGPHIVAAHRTVIAGPNAVLPSNSTQASGDDRRALLPILVENASLFVAVDPPAELRAVFDSHTDVDVASLEERCPSWADALWDVFRLLVRLSKPLSRPKRILLARR